MKTSVLAHSLLCSGRRERSANIQCKHMILKGDQLDSWARQVSVRLGHGLATKVRKF